MVEIIVGLEKHKFCVHKDLLCSRIEYFKKMFNGEFKEAKEQVATLPEDDPAAFSLFMEWLYTGRLKPIAKKTSGAALMCHIKLYGFAEKICEDQLSDFVMTTILSQYRVTNTLPKPEAIQLAYELTMSESRLREFMLDSFIYVFGRREYSETHLAAAMGVALGGNEDLATEFTIKVRKSCQTNLANIPSPINQNNCYYHWHGTDPKCPYSANNV